MSGVPWRELRTAVGARVKVSDPSCCRLALVIFGNKADAFHAFSADFASVKGAMPQRCPGGMTAMKTGIEAAEALLWPTQRRRVVLLSDGMPTHGDPLAAARRLGEAGVVIDTVGCGVDVDEVTMRAIAAVGGGKYVPCSQVGELRRVFRALETRARGLLGEWSGG